MKKLLSGLLLVAIMVGFTVPASAVTTEENCTHEHEIITTELNAIQPRAVICTRCGNSTVIRNSYSAGDYTDILRNCTHGYGNTFDQKRIRTRTTSYWCNYCQRTVSSYQTTEESWVCLKK